MAVSSCSAHNFLVIHLFEDVNEGQKKFLILITDEAFAKIAAIASSIASILLNVKASKSF
uniref:Uncharacterized protein n=1 Tax=Romanomermis culicivorax TaxID=13658 RepID=A0A915JWY8_ROMCU